MSNRDDALVRSAHLGRRYAVLLLALILFVTPLLAACGGDDDDDAPTPTATTEAAAASPTADETKPTSDEATPTEADDDEDAATPTVADASPTADDPVATETGEPGQTFEGGDPLMGVQIEEPENEGGTFIEGVPSDVSTLNPVLASDDVSFDFLALIFESLVELHPETSEPVGLLADAWSVSADGLAWNFHLRDGVLWHDGEPLRAQDVVFTYELHMNEESNSAYVGDVLTKIESVEAVDDLTVVFTLPQPYADFAVDIATYPIIAEHIWADVPAGDVIADPGSTGEEPERVVGTGPFVFSEWIPNDHLTATANEEYWGGAPILDEYIYKVVPDPVAGVQQLRTGEIDWFSAIPGSSVEEFEDADVELTVSDTSSFLFYGYNMDEERTTLFQDQAVRQALLYALDREAMVDAIMNGYATVAIGTMPTMSWAYNPEGIENHYPYDPELAEQLLDEAGWVVGDDGVREKDGQRLSFRLHTNSDNPDSIARAAAMQEFWAEIGVEMTPEVEPFPALIERISSTFDFDIFMIGLSWGASPDQSSMFACDAYGAGINVMRYCNEEVDQLLADALTEQDPDTRLELYTEFQNIIMEDLPAAILFFPQLIDGYSTRVHNLYANAVNSRFNVETWWVEQ